MNKFSYIVLQKCFTDKILKKDFNKELFSLIAPKYNLATRILSLGRDQIWKKKLISELPKTKKPVCLDIACGTGDVTFKLAKKYRDAKIFGLDLSEEMIKNAEKNNFFQNVEFVCQDMCNTNFQENNFDIITASYALRNAPDLNLALKEIKRILKANGTLAILDFSKFENKFAQKFQYYLLKFWGFFCGLILHAKPNVYVYISESLKHHPPENEFLKIIENLDFKILQKKKFFFGIIHLIILQNQN